VPATPVPRPPWLKAAATLAVVGVLLWPILAMLGLLGVVPAQAVLNTGLVTAALAYISIRRIKHDRSIAMGDGGFDPSDVPPGEPGSRSDPARPPRGSRPGPPPSGGTRRRPPDKPDPR
jgi:hypothetical protein